MGELFNNLYLKGLKYATCHFIFHSFINNILFKLDKIMDENGF